MKAQITAFVASWVPRPVRLGVLMEGGLDFLARLPYGTLGIPLSL